MRFRLTSLTGLLYTALLSIPLVSVLSKVIYVQSNKNAYQSAEITHTTYSRTPKYTQGDINNGLEQDKIYHFETQFLSPSDIVIEGEMYFEVINGGFTSISSRDTTFDDGVFIETHNSTVVYVLNDMDEMFLNVYSDDLYYAIFLDQAELQFNGDILINEAPTTYETSYFSNTTYQDYDYFEIESTTLDNVFEYAIDKVIAENNFGKIDFFSYFTSIFMNDNATNNRYIGYVNYYLNYALMVSLAYLLFMLLMWFVNFARKFLDRGMNYDW